MSKFRRAGRRVSHHFNRLPEWARLSVTALAALVFFGFNAIRTIKIDIFPNMNMPVIYLSHPYGGYTPDQMESYFGKGYVNLMLYVSGVKSIETKNIQGLTLMKLTFYENTNMAQAAAEVSAFSNRAQALFPPGSQPPFILRFDASTLPIGQLVLSSPTRTNNELLDFEAFMCGHHFLLFLV